MATEHVYLGYANSIVLSLEDGGVAVDLSGYTDADITIGSDTVESDNDATDPIRWAQAGYATGELRLYLGDEDLTPRDAAYSCPLVLYDAVHPSGILWGSIDIIVHPEVDVTPTSTYLTEFTQHIIIYVPGCSDMLAEQFVLNTIRDFCERTDIWKYTLDAISSVAEQRDYELSVPSETELVTIINATYDDNPLDPVIETQMDWQDSYWRSADSGTPTSYAVLTPGYISLYPTPEDTESDILSVRVSLKPTVTATTVEGFLYTDWLDAIISGTLARLMAIPKKNWTDVQLSQFYLRKYESYLSRGIVRSTTGHVRKALRVKPSYFA